MKETQRRTITVTSSLPQEISTEISAWEIGLHASRQIFKDDVNGYSLPRIFASWCENSLSNIVTGGRDSRGENSYIHKLCCNLFTKIIKGMLC
jgi:hypothetical protein